MPQNRFKDAGTGKRAQIPLTLFLTRVAAATGHILHGARPSF